MKTAMMTKQHLDRFVVDHRVEIMAEALHAFALYWMSSGNDVWGTFTKDHQACDFNVYQPDESLQIFVTAYALDVLEDGTIHVNTQTGRDVGHVNLEE